MNGVFFAIFLKGMREESEFEEEEGGEEDGREEKRIE